MFCTHAFSQVIFSPSLLPSVLPLLPPSFCYPFLLSPSLSVPAPIPPSFVPPFFVFYLSSTFPTPPSLSHPPSFPSYHSYLYYVDGLTIYRVDTNGRHKTYIDASIYDIIGLAIDTSLNQLYWSTAQGTKYKTPPDSDSTPLELNVDTNPHGLAADNGILYWTVLGNVSISIPGEIYMYMLNGSQGGPHQLLSNNDIRPLDISTSLRQSK